MLWICKNAPFILYILILFLAQSCNAFHFAHYCAVLCICALKSMHLFFLSSVTIWSACNYIILSREHTEWWTEPSTAGELVLLLNISSWLSRVFLLRRVTLRGFTSSPVVDSSTASVWCSSRAMASSPSPTPSGTCSWRWLQPCTTTPSGNTSTGPQAPTPSSGHDHSSGTPVLHLLPAHQLPQLPAEAATTAEKFTKK